MNESKLNALFLGILAMFAIGVVLSELQSVLLPFVIAMFLSFIFKPIVLFLRKWKFPMFIALLVVLLTVAGIVFGLSMILSSTIESFITELPKYQSKLNTLIDQIALFAQHSAASLGIDLMKFNIADAIQVSSLTSIVTSGVGSFFSFIGNGFMILLFMIFILAGSGELTQKIANAFETGHSDRLAAMIDVIDDKVRQYLVAKTAISLATGALVSTTLAIMGVDFALLWGFITFLLNYIPNVGSLIAIFFPVAFALLQFDTLTIPLVTLVILVILQNVMGNVIEPKLMAFSLNLSPLLVVVALIFWGWLWGIWGMILAVPITSMMKIIFENVDQLKPIAVLMSGTVKEKK